MAQSSAFTPFTMIVAGLVLLVAYGLGLAVYRLYFHPLAKYDVTVLAGSDR